MLTLLIWCEFSVCWEKLNTAWADNVEPRSRDSGKCIYNMLYFPVVWEGCCKISSFVLLSILNFVQQIASSKPLNSHIEKLSFLV